MFKDDDTSICTCVPDRTVNKKLSIMSVLWDTNFANICSRMSHKRLSCVNRIVNVKCAKNVCYCPFWNICGEFRMRKWHNRGNYFRIPVLIIFILFLTKTIQLYNKRSKIDMKFFLQPPLTWHKIIKNSNNIKFCWKFQIKYTRKLL